MTNIQQLDQRLQEKMAVNEARLRLRQDDMQAITRVADQAHAAYTTVADRLMEAVIRPRVAAVKTHLDPVAAAEAEGSRHTAGLRLPHSPRFPATVYLEIGISRDGDERTLIVQYQLQMLPVFFPYDRSADLKFPIDKVDVEQAGSWLDDKLIGFVDTYLRLEVEGHYPNEKPAGDPV